MNNNLGTIRFLAAFGVLFGHTYNLAIGKHGPLDPVSALIHKVSPFYVGLPGVAGDCRGFPGIAGGHRGVAGDCRGLPGIAGVTRALFPNPKIN